MKNVAIFNGFLFHYEMFGYIIHYCQRNQFKLTIYTENRFDQGWFHFYSTLFKEGSQFIIRPRHLFGAEHSQFDLVILTTDDDPHFKDEWVSPKVVKINHINYERRFNILNAIYTRPSSNVVSNWALPCFPIIDLAQKLNDTHNSKEMHIVIISNYGEYVCDVFNRFDTDENCQITLHFANRFLAKGFELLRSQIRSDILIETHIDIDASKLIQLITNSDYVCIETSSYPQHYEESMSGAIPLAYSCLTPLIMDKKMNAFYRFTNAIEYDIDGVEPIHLLSNNKYNDSIVNVEKERTKLIAGITRNLNAFCNNRNTALIVEPRALDCVPSIIQQYQTVLGSEWSIVFYCGSGLKPYWSDLLSDQRVDIRELDVNDLTSNQYNDLLKTRELWESLTGEFVLVFQTDSWIHWDDVYNIDFFMGLNKSFIGGNMSYQWNELVRECICPPCRNFNGGLSLRKRVDALRIIESFPPQPTVIASNALETDAEDVYFTIGAHKLGLPLGSDEQCGHFAVHTIFKERWFGVHGPNLPVFKDLVAQDCSNSSWLDFVKPRH